MVRGGCTSTWEGEGSELCRAGLTAALTGAGGVRGKPVTGGLRAGAERDAVLAGWFVCMEGTREVGWHLEGRRADKMDLPGGQEML